MLAVAKPNLYAGLFLVTMATLMFELLLTRIFSVTMWYHFAFMAISIAIFGMTAGAILVYLKPNLFSKDSVDKQLALHSILFAVTTLLCSWLQFNIRFLPLASWIGFATLTAIYVVTSVPFIFSGICVCLALTRYPKQISKLYAADLLGAAAGCIVLPFVLGAVGGPTSIIFVAALVAAAAVFFGLGAGQKLLSSAIATLVIMLVMIPANVQANFLKLAWIKGFAEQNIVYEKWNSFSRIRVAEEREQIQGVTTARPPFQELPTKRIDIDSTAATALIPGTVKPSENANLIYNVCASAHKLRPNANVAVIGVGGGVDILTALAYGQPHVLGIELNNDILKVITEKYADFTGNIHKNPAVRLVNDEARSYLERTDEKFDIIQISLIDTWAATSAGAFVLSENSLYTTQAWKVFLQHLTPTGVLSCARWYYRDRQDETHRIVSLAASALREVGITENPQAHLFLLTNLHADAKGYTPDMGIGTLLVSKTAYSPEDIKTINQFAKDQELVVVLSPESCKDETLRSILGPNAKEFIANHPLNIAAPTDDSPFFFQMAKLSTWMKPELATTVTSYMNMIAISTLMALLCIVTFLTAVCIVIPLAMTAHKYPVKAASPLLTYFCFIGFGYMFVEISQMQRLAIFLGHPTYGLFVVLFTFLLSSGLGSYMTHWLENKVKPELLLALLLVALVVFGLATPMALAAAETASMPVRIATTVGLLFPIGLLMGASFPLGMKLATPRFEAMTPWFWGLNGATTVCASVLAVVIAIGFGITIAYYTGVVCYLLAVFAFVVSIKSATQAADSPSATDQTSDAPVG
jgi:predicted membrane-bound spermidine synthase